MGAARGGEFLLTGSARTGTWAVFALSLLGALVGVGVVVNCLISLSAAPDAKTWPTTAGEITHSAVDERDGWDGDNSENVYRADVRYRYEVNGAPHEGQGIGPGSDALSPVEVDAAVLRYPVGAAVEVHYDPDDPAGSCLDADAPQASPYLALGLGLSFMVFGLAFAHAVWTALHKVES